MVHVKSEEEIDLMRAPCAIVRDCLSFVGERIRPGMTTAEVDKLVYDFIKASGAEPSCLGYGGFPASACVSVNEVVVHGIPDDRVLEEGDIVSVDLCAYKNGFHGDGARTIAVGEITPQKKKHNRETDESIIKALEVQRPAFPSSAPTRGTASAGRCTRIPRCTTSEERVRGCASRPERSSASSR